MHILLIRLLGRYGTAFKTLITIPIATVGYYVEGLISSRYTPPTAPVMEQREKRLLANIDSMPSKEKHSPLEVNLSPSLST